MDGEAYHSNNTGGERMSDGTLEQSTDLCEYSTKELAEELCKREGVASYHSMSLSEARFVISVKL